MNCEKVLRGQGFSKIAVQRACQATAYNIEEASQILASGKKIPSPGNRPLSSPSCFDR